MWVGISMIIYHTLHDLVIADGPVARASKKHSAGVRSSLFCDVTQCRLVVSYWCFRTTYCSHLQGSSSPRRILWLLTYTMQHPRRVKISFTLYETSRKVQDSQAQVLSTRRPAASSYEHAYSHCSTTHRTLQSFDHSGFTVQQHFSDTRQHRGTTADILTTGINGQKYLEMCSWFRFGVTDQRLCGYLENRLCSLHDCHER
jgi:hypothetical protein